MVPHLRRHRPGDEGAQRRSYALFGGAGTRDRAADARSRSIRSTNRRRATGVVKGEEGGAGRRVETFLPFILLLPGARVYRAPATDYCILRMLAASRLLCRAALLR